MNRPFAATASSPSDTLREDWLRAGILAGFLATFAMSVVLVGAYWLAEAVGVQDGNALQRWSYALVNNPVADRTAESVVLAIGANLAVGLLLALAYARYFEPRFGAVSYTHLTLPTILLV